MEHCSKEKEIDRLTKIVAGNGGEGLVTQVGRLNQKVDDMCEDIKELIQTADLQNKAVNGFARYQASQELLEEYKRSERQQRKQMMYFTVAQSIAIIGLVLTLILK